MACMRALTAARAVNGSRITQHASCSDIGVISDTHNYLDPRIPKLFAGVDHILHGGDIGLPAIILAAGTDRAGDRGGRQHG